MAIILGQNQRGSGSVVEHLLAKEKVAGSNPVFRSNVTRALPGCFRVLGPRHTVCSRSRSCERGRGGMADAAVLKTVRPPSDFSLTSLRSHQGSVEWVAKPQVVMLRLAVASQQVASLLATGRA